MRLAFLIILSSLCFSALGMPTSQCPRVLTVKVKDLRLSPPSDHLKAQQTALRLSETGRMSIRFGIKFAGAGKCHYEGRDLDGSFFWANLGEDTKSEVSTQYVLNVRSNSIKFLVPISEVSLKGPKIEQEDVDLFYKEKGRGTEETSIGFGTLIP